MSLESEVQKEVVQIAQCVYFHAENRSVPLVGILSREAQPKRKTTAKCDLFVVGEAPCQGTVVQEQKAMEAVLQIRNITA